MSVYVKFSFKAPQLVEFLKNLGIQVSVNKGVFDEMSTITLPSGASACVFDPDAWRHTLYLSEDMILPRCLNGIGSGKSLVSWLFAHLTEVDEDIDFYDEEEEGYDGGISFCQEIANILAEKYTDDMWNHISQLDDLIEEAELLYFNYWDGTDFDYSYASVKNGKLQHYKGSGTEEPDIYGDWRWRDLDDFIKLIKKNISATIYERNDSKWVKA